MFRYKPQQKISFYTAVATLLGVFILDVFIPLGVAVGLLYVLVVLLLVRHSSRVIVTASVVSVLLTLIVPVFTFDEFTTWMAFVNRGLSVVAITAAAATALRFDLNQSERDNEMYLEAGHRMLEEKNKQLEQYMYIASHNLNEPLQTISSFVDIIREDHREEMSEDLTMYFSFVEGATKKMRLMISGLLGFSRTGQDKPLRQVDLNDVVDQVGKDLAENIAAADVQLSVSSLPVVVGMKTELRQLFGELILNAIKFQPEGNQPRISVSYEEDALVWTFCVADNGIGIEQKEQENIFDMFTKLHREEVYPGQGIGLALCAKIVDLHMGKIWMESEQGQGARFYFTIMKSPA